MPLKLKSIILFVMTLALLTGCGEQSATTVTIQTASVKLPTTGQTLCYDAAGAAVSCTGTGQDGEMRKGGAWSNPRFTDQNLSGRSVPAARSVS